MPEQSPLSRRRLLALGAAMALTAPLSLALARPDASTKRKTRKDKDRKGSGKKDRKKNKKQHAGGSNDAHKVVNEAKKHKGAKYKWGGASPKGFDCSGFTWYVYDRAVGKDIGRTVKAQYKQGKSVSKGSWKPGDVVFFKNTFENGLSHNGIYLGGGKFIHAENEDTGVVISNLESGYYENHYAGARRML